MKNLADLADMCPTMPVLPSVTDPYHFYTDPDPGCEKCVTDPDPDPGQTLIRIRILIKAKTIRIRIQQEKDLVPGKSLKRDEKRSNPMFCGCILLINHLSINNHLNQGKKVKFILCFSWIQIRIICYGSEFRIQPFFDTDPYPGKLYRFHESGSATLVSPMDPDQNR